MESLSHPRAHLDGHKQKNLFLNAEKLLRLRSVELICDAGDSKRYGSNRHDCSNMTGLLHGPKKHLHNCVAKIESLMEIFSFTLSKVIF